jgi:acyl carrier protein
MPIEVKTKFQNIFKRHFHILPYQLMGRKYLTDLGLTKIEQLEMLNDFEEEFQIKFSENDEKQIKTVEDTLLVLEKRICYNTPV